MSLSVVNDEVSVDVSQNEMEGNIGLESSDGNLRTASVTVITKEDTKSSQALMQEIKFVENKKLGGTFESNLQEMERSMSPLPQSNCFDEMQSPSTFMMSEITPNTTGYNREMGETIAHLPAQNKDINKTGSHAKRVSTQGSKSEAINASMNEQNSTLDQENNGSVVNKCKKTKTPQGAVDSSKIQGPAIIIEIDSVNGSGDSTSNANVAQK